MVTGDLDGAIADYGAAIRRDPLNADIYRGRAKVLRVRGEDAAAAKDVERAEELTKQAAERKGESKRRGGTADKS